MTFRLKRTIFGRFVLRVCETRHTLDMANPVSCYETLGRGATASARREIRELESPR